MSVITIWTYSRIAPYNTAKIIKNKNKKHIIIILIERIKKFKQNNKIRFKL